MNQDEALALFFHWIQERESIRFKRAGGQPPPWTKDSILHCYHFCNVRRQDDRGTKEIQGVVRKYVDKVEDLPAVYTVARLFNHAPSLEVFLNGGGWGELKTMSAAGKKLFNTAYVVSTAGQTMNKVDYVQRVHDKVKTLEIPKDSCRDAFIRLRAVHGLGSFLCGQIIADLKNDRYLIDAVDWATFSVMGPGSKKGLDILFGSGTTEVTYADRIRKLKGLLPEPVAAVVGENMQDLQNCLCEFSKYVRLKEKLPGRRRPYNVYRDVRS